VNKLAIGQGFNLARKIDGSLWTWEPTTQPTQVANLANVTSFASGNYVGVAVEMGGTVKTWGSNQYGQLGDGSTGVRLIPQTVPGLSGALAVATSASSSHVLALKTDGTVLAWGDNSFGQLGSGNTVSAATPQVVPGLSGIVQVACCGVVSYALKSDGTVLSWGGGDPVSYGGSQLGRTGNYLIPLPVIGLPPIASLVPGGVSLGQAIASDGTVWSWGNKMLQGRGFTSTDETNITPVKAFGLTNVVSLANTQSTAYAVKSDGTAWVWGYDYGNGTAWTAFPQQVVGIEGLSSTLSTLGTNNLADSWLLNNFSESELVSNSSSGDTADPDKDGIPNLLEYALGLNPRALTSSGLPTARTDLIGATAQSESAGSEVQLFSTPTVDLTSGKRYLAYTVDRSSGIRQDIDYIVEVSNDLINWNSGDPYTVTVLDTAETLEVYSATSLDDVPRQFMRLKIQRK